MVDIVARLLAEGMKGKFPKGVLVANRTGAGGAVAAAEVATGKPDGHTIVLTPLSTLVIQPQILDLRFKTPDDYEPVINVVSYYPLLVVQTGARWKNVQEFIAEAKANPGKMRVGSPGEDISYLNLELMRVTGTKMTHVRAAGARGPPRCSAATSRRWSRSLVKQSPWWTASGCAHWSCSRTRAIPHSRTRRPPRNSAGTSRMACGSC
jgi:tripartite-type tricarboxylate transporter receptor subunit TctC